MNTQLPNKASGTSEKGDGLHQSRRKGQRTKLSLIFGVNFSSCFSISGSAFCLQESINKTIITVFFLPRTSMAKPSCC